MLVAACRPAPTAVDAPPLLGGPVRAEPSPTGVVVGEDGTLVFDDGAPDPLEGMNASQRLAWARDKVPSLENRSTTDPAPKAFAGLLAWFDGIAERSIYMRNEAETQCIELVARRNGDGVLAKQGLVSTRKGKTKQDRWTEVSILATGIDELGTVEVRSVLQPDGSWRESAGSAKGGHAPLTVYRITEADDTRAVYRTYGYTLTAACHATETDEQHCQSGGTRSCDRCTDVDLEEHLPRDRVIGGYVAHTRFVSWGADCTRPCPADAVTALIPNLDRALEGHQFYDTGPHATILYRQQADCLADAAAVRT